VSPVRVCPACGGETRRRRCPDCDAPTGLVVVQDFFARRDRDALILEVVGESFRQEALRDLKARQGREVTVLLVREPTNVADPNAVQVVEHETRAALGYLKQSDAKRYARTIDGLGEVRCDAMLVGGERGKASIGVYLDATAVQDARDLDPKRAKQVAARKTRVAARRQRQPGGGCLPRAAMLLLAVALATWLM
jgi:hypothetical protein